MLSSNELKRVAQLGHRYDHAWRYTSLLAGEPFLIDGSLLHFDSRHLYILDFPLSPEDGGVASQFDAVIRDFKPSLVWYSGARPLESSRMPEALRPIHRWEPDLADVCMEILLNDFRLGADNKRAGWIRGCERRGYRVTQSSPGFLGSAHIQMIERFVERANPGVIARAYIGCLGHFVRLPDAWLVEVWHANRLLAFGVVEGWFENMDVFLYGFAGPDAPGAFDLLQWAVIENARSRGKRILNVGYSIHAGIRAFKEKWGATPIGQGYYDQLWHAYDTPHPSHAHWPFRLLR